MELREKLDLIRLLMKGEEEEAAALGFCAGERGDMTRYLIDHGYLARGSGGGAGSRAYRPTPEGARFLERLDRRRGS